jgi:hypothetical protein
LYSRLETRPVVCLMQEYKIHLHLITSLYRLKV